MSITINSVSINGPVIIAEATIDGVHVEDDAGQPVVRDGVAACIAYSAMHAKYGRFIACHTADEDAESIDIDAAEAQAALAEWRERQA